MSIQSLIDQLAASEPPTCDQGLPELVALHDLLEELSDSSELSDETLAELAAEAVACLHRVVLRETDEAEAELQKASVIIAQLQEDLGAEATQPIDNASPEQPDIACIDGLERFSAELLAVDAADATDLASAADTFEALLQGAAGSLGEEHEPLAAALSQLRQAAAGAAEDPQAVVDAVAEVVAPACERWRDIAETESTDDPVPDTVPESMQLLDEEVPPESDTTQDDPGDPDEDPEATADGQVASTSVEDATVPTPTSAQENEAPAATQDPRLPMDTDMDLLREFATECLDHIVAAEAALLELESHPDDNEQVNTIFRAFHTIKGTSGFLGLDCIQALSHLAENLLDRARNGEIRVVGGYADLALNSCDALKTMIEGIENVEPGGLLPMPGDYESMMVQLRDPEAAGASEESEVEPLRTGDILVARDAVKRERVEEVAKEQGGKRIGRALVEQGDVSAAEAVNAIRTQQGGRARAGEATVRVGTDRLDRLIDAVGELVIAQSMVGQDPAVTSGEAEQLTRNVAHSGKIVRELQEVSMSLRMVPLKATFGKMARLSRDLARKAGKKVQFVSEGEDTEIDRNLVETLNDPLVHMMRNSVDHGIEMPEDRLAAGKEALGTVRLRAYHSAGNVVIELSDDGKGLDRDRIHAKALERGLIQPGEALSDSDVYGLIFRAGFSTAEKITDVSGRGVGMDVVKTGIESLRGRVEVDSKPGEGTKLTIRLPLTMAITDAMLVRVAAERFMLPIVSIEQSFRPEAGQISTVVGRGELVDVRGELLPVVRLYEVFDTPDAASSFEEALLIVVEGENKRYALMVDELLGQQQVVVKSLGRSLGQIDGVSGGAILGDGRVGLILDPAGLMELAHTRDGRSRVHAITTEVDGATGDEEPSEVAEAPTEERDEL